MEKWLKDAEERARSEAEHISGEITGLADELQVDREWFFEEVMKHINKPINSRKDKAEERRKRARWEITHTNWDNECRNG